MAYVYCRKCGFEQDDFWSDTYNPISRLKHWENLLVNGKIDNLFSDCNSFISEHGNITTRELIARECEQSAKIIRETVYRTEKEWYESHKVCPMCDEILTVD